jgi:hypothetical protein
MFTLTGGPAELIRAAVTNRSSLFVYDLPNDKLFTGPDYYIEGVAPASQTNLLAPPKLKLKK